MGFLDKIKGLASSNKGAVKSAVDKVADVVETKTPDSVDDKVEQASETVKGIVDKLDD